MFTRISALVVLVILFPFLLILSLLILVLDRYNPIFAQNRVGHKEKNFTCIKFQTLKPTTESHTYNDPVSDNKRLTKLGILLRDRGWDELPQLLNILLGHMSFMGPRPLPESSLNKLLITFPEKKNYIKQWWKLRVQVEPGLSGWHQVNLADPDIIKYDMEWLENPDLAKRIKIFLASVLILSVGKKRYFKENIPSTYEYILD